MIHCANPHAQYASHRDEIDAAVLRVLASGAYILGDEVRAFEAEFAAYTGTSFASGVASGTDALQLALRACGVGAGDEVVTVAHTAVATVAAIEQAGATPVLVDIDPRTFTLDPERLEAALTPRTKAIIPVHLYGQAADLTPILEIARPRNVRVIEDCAQAHGVRYRGRRVGSVGDMGCFSFYPTKNLGAVGDGGAVVTSDADLADRVRLLREYGWAERYVSHVPGVNSRLDELQAAVLRVKLKYLDADNARRQEHAAQYSFALNDCGLVLPATRRTGEHVFHLYVVRSARRDALQAHLASKGIRALVHYPRPVHLQPAYSSHLRGGLSLPETERAASEVLSLPMYPELTPEEIATTASAVRDFQRRHADVVIAESLGAR